MSRGRSSARGISTFIVSDSSTRIGVERDPGLAKEGATFRFVGLGLGLLMWSSGGMLRMELHNVILKGTGSEFELRKYQGFWTGLEGVEVSA